MASKKFDRSKPRIRSDRSRPRDFQPLTDEQLDTLYTGGAAAARDHVARWFDMYPPLKAKIAKALQHDGFLSKPIAEEAAFHMTDWVVNLQDLNNLFRSRKWNMKQARSVLMQFVSHAPNHLVAAHKIIYGDPVVDVFEIGAVKGTGRAKRKIGAPVPNPRRRPLRRKRSR